MNNQLLEAFLDQLHSSSSSKSSSKKLLYVDASYEWNTKSFQRYQQQDKVRSLTLGEASREIHYLKAEISTLKSKVAYLEKEKQPLAKNISAHTNAYRLLAATPEKRAPSVK